MATNTTQALLIIPNNGKIMATINFHYGHRKISIINFNMAADKND